MTTQRLGLGLLLCPALIAGLSAFTFPFNSTHGDRPIPAVCAPADDFTALLLSKIQRLVTSTDTGDVATRIQLQWPSVTATTITYVADNAVCSATEAAYTPAVPASVRVAPSGMMYAFKIDTVYFVFDRAQRAGEWVIAMTLDRRFKVLVKTRI